MKKLTAMRTLLIIITICFGNICFAQSETYLKNDTLYTTSGFKITIGQYLKAGVGSMPDADFKFIRRSSTSLFNYTSQTGYYGLANQANSFPRNASGHEFKVVRIDKRGSKKNGYVYYPILGGGVRYEVDIDNAIRVGEIVVPEEFMPKEKNLQVEVKQNISIADELKKLNELRKDSVITEEEFQAQKKKLLGE